MRHNNVFLRCCCFTLMLQVLPASGAEPPSLEELLDTRLQEVHHELDVETTGRTTQNSRQHGNLTYILTADDIRQFGMRSLADILDYFPGLYISRDPAFSYVGVRGLGQPNDYNSRLLFLLDGIRLNEAIFDAGLLGSDALIDIENIDRVEFSAGPGGSVYGNNAFFGVLQIFSKKAAGGQSNLVSSYGSNGSERYHLSTTHRYDNGNEVYASASYENINQLWLGIETPAEFDNTYEQLSDEHVNRFRLGGKVAGVQLQALLSKQHRHLPAVLQSPDGLQLNKSRDQNRGSLLAAQYQTAGELWQLSTSLSVSDNSFRRLQPFYNRTSQQMDGLLDDQRSRWSAAQLIWQYDGWLHHQLMTGYERQQAMSKDILVWQTSTGRLLQEITGQHLRQSWFIQDTWQFNPDHYLAAGVRLDNTELQANRWSPRLSWSWRLSEATQLKLQFGTAFRTANHYEAGLNQALEFERPQTERIKSTEFSIEHLLNRQIGLRFTAFRSKVEQLILYDGIFFNAIPLNSLGTELTAQWRGQHGQDLAFGWSWQQSDFAGLAPLNSPRHLLKLLYQQPLWHDALRLSISAQSRSGRWSTYSYLPGYAHWQFGLLWQATPQHQLSLQLQNLFDKRYQHQPLTYTPALEQPGRTVWLSWQWQLP